MKTIAVIFGGKSVEHDISIITGMQTIKNLSPAYNIIPIYITKQGEWWTGDNLKNLEFYELFNTKKLKNCFFKAPHSELFIVNKIKNESKLMKQLINYFINTHIKSFTCL